MPTVSAKVSQSEKIEFEKIAESHNLTVSKIIKMAFSKAEIRDHSVEKNANQLIRKAGINLNQIVHHLNIGNPIDLQISEQLKNIEKQNTEILKRLSR